MYELETWLYLFSVTQPWRIAAAVLSAAVAEHYFYLSELNGCKLWYLEPLILAWYHAGYWPVRFEEYSSCIAELYKVF